MEAAGRAKLPKGLMLIPCVPPKLDAQGRPVGEVQLLLARAPDGTMVAYAYTSPELLAAAHGSAQPWVAVTHNTLADVLAREEVRFLVLDASSPDGVVITGDGDRWPVETFSWDQVRSEDQQNEDED